MALNVRGSFSMQYHKRLFIPAGRMPTHAVSGLHPYGPVSLPKTPHVLKSLHFESLHGEKLDALDRQIGPSGQVPMVPGSLKVNFRMAENQERSGTIRHSIRIDFRRMRFCK